MAQASRETKSAGPIVRRNTLLGRILISAGAGIAAVPWWVAAARLLLDNSSDLPLPGWGKVVIACCSPVLLAGLLVGSRGTGRPLTGGVLLELLTSPPDIVFVSAYVIGFALVLVLEASGA